MILNASAGLNYKTFIQMLRVIAANRLEYLNDCKQKCEQYTLETNMHNCKIDGYGARVKSCENNEIQPTLEAGNESTEKVRRSDISCVCRERKENVESVVSVKPDSSKATCDTNKPCIDTVKDGRGVPKADLNVGIKYDAFFGSDSKDDEKNVKSKYYCLFDLRRIEEIIKDVIKDTDYQALEIKGEESAEYVLQMVKEVCEDMLEDDL